MNVQKNKKPNSKLLGPCDDQGIKDRLRTEKALGQKCNEFLASVFTAVVV